MKINPVAGPSDPAFLLLLRAFQGGEENTINNALSCLGGELSRLVRYFSPPACDIPALEQAARFGALKAASRFDEKRSSDFGAFAKMTIKDAVRDEFARLDCGRIPLVDKLPDLATALLVRELETSPALEILRKESLDVVIQSVRAWISTRPARQRDYFRLHFNQGFSKAEVARTMGISKAAVTKMHLKLVAAGKAELAALEQYLFTLN